MSLLTMVQNVCKSMGLEAPTNAYSSTDRHVMQVIRCIYDTGEELRNRVSWPELLKEHNFTLVASTGAYALPSDLDRVHSETHWNDNDTWPIMAMTPQEYEMRQRGILSSTSMQHFIAKGSSSTQFTIYPTPTSADAGHIVYYMYQSKYWLQTSAGTNVGSFTADTNVSNIYEPLVELGAKWRFKYENSLPYAEDKKLYYDSIPVRATAKQGGRSLSICGGNLSRRFLTTANLPEGNWG